MNELPAHARRLLEIARRLDDPEPERRATADSALRTALAAHGVTNLPPLGAASSLEAVAALRSGPRLTFGLKLALGTCAIVAFATGAWQLRAAPRSKPVAAAQSAPTLPPAQEIARTAPVDAGAATPRLALRARAVKRSLTPNTDVELRAELQLLGAVDSLLRGGRYLEALRKLSESEPAPGGRVLAEERRALFVLALCGAGHAAASQERERFLARAPRAVLAERVRAACTKQALDEP